MSGKTLTLDWEKSGGLIPAVIQDSVTGRVLMLGYMNKQALDETERSGLVTFYSRSRGRLWTKGETSGNRLELESVHADCDGDTLLVRARATGPTCHTGAETCFEQPELPVETIGRLARTITERAGSGDENSYTRRLLSQGTKACAAKVTEEAEEVVRATSSEGHQRTIEEAADLIYHLLVLFRCQEIDLEEVASELRARRAQDDG